MSKAGSKERFGLSLISSSSCLWLLSFGECEGDVKLLFVPVVLSNVTLKTRFIVSSAVSRCCLLKVRSL